MQALVTHTIVRNIFFWKGLFKQQAECARFPLKYTSTDAKDIKM